MLGALESVTREFLKTVLVTREPRKCLKRGFKGSFERQGPAKVSQESF